MAELFKIENIAFLLNHSNKNECSYKIARYIFVMFVLKCCFIPNEVYGPNNRYIGSKMICFSLNDTFNAAHDHSNVNTYSYHIQLQILANPRQKRTKNFVHKAIFCTLVTKNKQTTFLGLFVFFVNGELTEQPF